MASVGRRDMEGKRAQKTHEVMLSAEEALRQSEEKYRFLFEAMPVGVSITDFEGTIVIANRALREMLGLTQKDLATSKIVGAYGDPTEREDLLGRLRESGNVRDWEIRLKDEKDASITRVALLNLDLVQVGQDQLILTTYRDITQRKKVEDELRQSLDRLKETLEETINALASLVEQRDPYTAGHQRHVAYLACAIAKEMGVPQDRIDGIEMAGIVHDVGKIAIPADILSVPRQLTEAEFSLVKTHPQVGYNVLQPIAFPWPVAEIVFQHHERINGSGYPQALSGRDSILLEARILAVADVVEAMSSHRPYRPSLGIDKALEEISAGKGVLYDPEVVDACVKLFAERGFTLTSR